MALIRKSSNRDIPPAITEIVKSIAEKYDIPTILQNVIEEQVVTAMGSSKLALPARSKRGGLISLAKDVLNRGTKSRLEDSPAAQQLQPIQGLNSEKVKLLLQGLIGLGSILKSGANITPAKPAPVAANSGDVLPTATTTTPTIAPLKTTTKKEEKDFIKDKDAQVVILGGITNEGVADLQKKLPVVLKDVLDELKKGLKEIKLPEIKVPTAATTSEDGGGLIGTALDFFRKKKGTTAGNISRNRKAKQLRAQRAARTAATDKTLKTTEAPKRSIPKDGTPETKAARSSRAQELRAERAARKVETGTTLKTAETGAARGIGRAATRGAGKAVTKGAGKALLKSGLKKIPVLGAVAGLGFGAQRALQGDWLGAAGEVASGAAGSIPGLGTAASVGIDAALAARDISKEINQPEVSSDTIKETPSTPVETGETIQPFKEGNQDLKPVSATPAAPTPPAPTEINPNKDILTKIAENTGNTNSSIGALIQAIYKLAQSMGGKTGAPPVIVNGGQQKQDVGPSASQVAAANNDPIRAVRAQFAP